MEALAAFTATLLAMLLPVIYDGVERKVKALMQSRIGPPVYQTILDLRKLMSKETVEFPSYPLVFYTIVLSIILEAALIAVLNTVSLGVYTAQLVPVAIALIAVAQTTSIAIPLLVPNPYSQVGGMREAMLALVNEFSLIAGLTLYYYAAHPATSIPRLLTVTVPLIVLLVMTTYVSTGRTPFDIAEAEVELASGVLVELSGGALALYLYSVYLKRYIASMLPALMVLLPLPLNGVVRLMIVHVAAFATWVLYSLPAVMLGRSRVDLAPATLFKIYIALILISITGLLVVT
ncbi:NADH-quinone oxidoreductase subunit H [Desulfurococcus mucosus]|uniref:Respiratory-chain NADH dehydrogenase subunit 1 n=1 Tax=Desulfurococcus mucosus (strain ATCC 35584 / DSM 2162 / JCM 9187 / O7/1) TaxID=765177 RepID=E8RAG5_DESM0|nr:NADH-quinone oxidoreductase subunit H [Desulfurococcus mucosus]ADV64375.1 respiratory-chain NADH dehydrogenase subunit 1 [Desulfurococcus mucosus DSM 2162]